MVNCNSVKRRLHAKQLSMWAATVSLALSALYSLLFAAKLFGEIFFVLKQRGMVQYAVSNVFVSASLDSWIWGGALLFVSGWLALTLYFNGGRGRFRVLCVLVPLAFVGLAGMFGFSALALASLMLVVFVFWFSGSCFGASRFGLARNLAVCSVSVLAAIEGASLVLLRVPAVLNLNPLLSLGAGHWEFVELGFSNLAYAFLPYAYFGFVVLGVVVFLVKVAPTGWFSDKLGEGLVQFVGRVRLAVSSCKMRAREPLIGRFPLWAAVLVSFALSSLFVVLTVLPWVNPTYRLVSVDAPTYYQWIIRMRGLDVNSALSFAVGNDRAAFLVLSYALSAFVSPTHLVQFMPALLIPLFCVVSLLVLRLFCGLRDALVFSVLLAPFSFQALGLIYSGYFANLLAVILVYFYFVLLVRVSRSWSTLGVFGLLAESVGILFSHSWTWFIFVLSLGAFLLLEWRSAGRVLGGLRGNLRVKVTLVAATVVVGFVCDFARKLLSAGSSSASVIATAQSSLSFPNLTFLFGGLRGTVSFFFGGFFANQLLFFLFFVGFLFMLSFRSEFSNFLVAWVFVCCVSMLFASGEFVFNRFLFLMPSVVFVGLGLSFVVRFVSGGSEGFWVKKWWVEFLVLVFVFLALLNYALRFVLGLNLL